MYSCDTSGEKERPPSIDIYREVDSIITMYHSGDMQGGQSSSSAARKEYPMLNPCAKDDESDEFDDSEEALGYRPVHTKSRIQSSLDKAFGGKWDPKDGEWSFF